MTIDPMSSIGAVAGIDRGVTAGSQAGGGDFASWLRQEINEVNAQIQTAETQVTQLAAGQSENLHRVMFSVEKAKLSFELLVQVRNKLLESYQEVMRMQV